MKQVSLFWVLAVVCVLLAGSVSHAGTTYENGEYIVTEDDNSDYNTYTSALDSSNQIAEFMAGFTKGEDNPYAGEIALPGKGDVGGGGDDTPEAPDEDNPCFKELSELNNMVNSLAMSFAMQGGNLGKIKVGIINTMIQNGSSVTAYNIVIGGATAMMGTMNRLEKDQFDNLNQQAKTDKFNNDKRQADVVKKLLDQARECMEENGNS